MGATTARGSCEPAARRKEMMVVGSRLKEAVFITASVIISRVGRGAFLASFFIFSSAASASGVAALPMPSKLALILAESSSPHAS